MTWRISGAPSVFARQAGGASLSGVARQSDDKALHPVRKSGASPLVSPKLLARCLLLFVSLLGLLEPRLGKSDQTPPVLD
jgi:hypothetical protein